MSTSPELTISLLLFSNIYIYIIETFDFLFTSPELATSLLLLFNYLTFFNYNFLCQPFKKKNYSSQKAKPDTLLPKNSDAPPVSFSFKISLPLNPFPHGKHKHKSDSHHNNSPQERPTSPIVYIYIYIYAWHTTLKLTLLILFVSTNSLSSMYVNFRVIKFGENLIKLCVVLVFFFFFGYLKIRFFF